ncbi:MAG: DUF371 domain-containing protein [Candidatus Lokiarchaeota archaeon]|nr:DUF371 domain-containing protein [Candidatus Lokiarchaeota archaeon]
MTNVKFSVYGHENVMATHRSTLELTSERTLTKRGNCIIGTKANLTLRDLSDEIKQIAKHSDTKIILRMQIGGKSEVIKGSGGNGLTYTNGISMVIRKSNFECDRTLMIKADKASIDLDREFVELAKNPNQIVHCTLEFIIE